MSYQPPKAINEVIKAYAPGSPERVQLSAKLASMSSERIELPLVIGGKEVRTGSTGQVVAPHRHQHVLADVHQGAGAQVAEAVEACRQAWPDWSRCLTG